MDGPGAVNVRGLMIAKHACATRESRLRDIGKSAFGCAGCPLRDVCLPAGLSDAELAQLQRSIGARRRVKRGELLWEAGEELKALYAVRLGFLKSFVVTNDGQVQVVRFQMSGEIVGLDAIATGRHQSTTVALDDIEVCPLPFVELQALFERAPALQRQFFRMMSAQIGRDQQSMALLGTMRADQRLAIFLLKLSEHYRARGYSANEFVLRMTREELGNYLGLKLETVSRLMSRLQREGLIRVANKAVKLLDIAALREMTERRSADA